MSGAYYWTARAVDAEGAASDWAGGYTFQAPQESEVPGDDDDDEGEVSGCNCQSDVADATGGGLAIFALLLPLTMRRRRS